jgi:fibronectin type 3 domain-containing protein
VQAVRNTIIADYNADPTNVKAVYILGHLPVPYSGATAPDGHGDHIGAWPSDTYYGEMTSTWTDTSINSVSATDKRNWNVPGDGKLDANSLPSALELGVGRVDLSNMTIFPNSATTETDLLRRYLRKAHQYRHRQGAYADIQRRAAGVPWGGYATGSKLAIAACLGRDAALTDLPPYLGDYSPWFAWAEANPSKTYLIGYGQGAGAYTRTNYVGDSADFGLRPSRAVFTSFFGSYFADWDITNNFLRAPLAGNASGDSLGLSCFWGSRPPWFMHNMAMGETLAYITRLSENNNSQYPPGYGGGAYMGLMGDPALRLYSVLPPQNLQARSSTGNVTLEWDASGESGLLGYLVYRADSPSGPFARLTASPIASPTYTDASGVSGSNYTYMVRTLKLETTPGGTFENPSQGVFATVNATDAATAIPLRPTALQLSAPDSTHLNLTWADNADNETGYRVERRVGSGTQYLPLASLSANTTTYTDAGPLTAGTVFYYRVVATGTDGESAPSDEVFLDGVSGAILLPEDTMHAQKSSGYVDIPVRRVGGSVGAVSISYSFSATTAIAGTHFDGTGGTVTWVDGESGIKMIRVPLLSSGSAQHPVSFKTTLSGPTGGASLAGVGATIVLIEDSTAALPLPWQQAMLDWAQDSGAVGYLPGEISSSIYGGSWIGILENGRYIYQSATGDTVMQAKMEAPSPVNPYVPSYLCLMVRDNVDKVTSKMLAIRVPDDASGTKFFARATDYASPTSAPSTNNGIKGPCWVKMTRSGNTFTGEISTDGSTWTVLGSATVAGMPTTVNWGFFHCTTTYIGDFQLAKVNSIQIGPPPPPAAPTGLTAGGLQTGGIRLSWTGVGTAPTGFRIERQLEGGSGFAEIATVAGTTTSYSDTTAAADTAYEYRVRAYNNGGDSEYSNIVTAATVHPDTPTNLTAGAEQAGGIALSWAGVVSAPTGFRIERRAEGALNFAEIATVAGTTTSYSDTTAAADTAYEYRIRAYSSSGESEYSNVSIAAAARAIQVLSFATTDGQGADAHILGAADADTNFGNSPALIMPPVSGKAYLRFDLSGRPPGATALAAELRLVVTESMTVDDYSEVYALPDSADGWSEGSITWNNAPFNETNTPVSYVAFLDGAVNIGYVGTETTISAGSMPSDESYYLLDIINGIDYGGYLPTLGENGQLTLGLSSLGSSNGLSFASGEHATYAGPTLEVTFSSALPPKASHLVGSVTAPGTISLAWSDNSGNESGFRVEVSTDGGGSYATLASLPADTTSLTTSSLPAVAGNQIYRVVALNAYGEATPSLPLTLAPLNDIEAWRLANGLPLDGSGEGSLTATPAGDGIPNLMKFALGIDAQVSGYQGHYSFAPVEDVGAEYLSLTYTRPEPAPEGISYIVEVGRDLSLWSDANTQLFSSAVVDGLRTITVRDKISIGLEQKRFIRLRIVPTPAP